ncbi:hypothetical protein N0V82_003359 [Gnomoniopsis sp. IMI 355080]|nr:hypothetical protein N0V82_003359 [Gnomoniopsis sp. IMI 355080]
MPYLRTLLLLLITIIPTPVFSGLQLDYADVPAPCVSTCRPVAELSGICDVDADFDDNNEEVEDLMKLQCLCTNTSFDVAGITALCASCIDQKGMPSDKDDNLDDVSEMITRCGFPTSVTWTPAVTAAAEAVHVIASRLTASGQVTTTVDFAPRPTCTRKKGQSKIVVEPRHRKKHGKNGGDGDDQENCFVPGKQEDD